MVSSAREESVIQRATAYPCRGPQLSALRTRTSSVPWRSSRSVGTISPERLRGMLDARVRKSRAAESSSNRTLAQRPRPRAARHDRRAVTHLHLKPRAVEGYDLTHEVEIHDVRTVDPQ